MRSGPRRLTCLLLAAASTAAVTVSRAEDPAESAAVLRDYLGRDLIFVTAPGIDAYLQSVARRLLATRPSPPPVPRFLIQSTSDFTVFTDTQGSIVVGTEVLRQLQSEDELAAALAHELAHVMAGHAQTKNVLQKIPGTAETTRLIATAVDQRRNGDQLRPGEVSEFSTDSLALTQDASAVWTDLVAPGWNRQQENEADLAAADMARAAGYDPAAFSTLFGRLDAAHAVRSDRVEKLRQRALARIQSQAPAPGASTRDQLLASLRGGAETAGVEALFQGLAGLGTDYAAPEARTAAVLAHVQQTSGGRRDKVPRSPRFQAELQSGAGRQLLDADLAALQVMSALNSADPAAARAPAEQLQALGPGLPSPHLNLALGSWLVATGKPGEAEPYATAWIASPLAPRMAWLWRADLQARRQDPAGALATLEQGAAALGKRDLFLPRMVATARAAGDAARADELTMECSRSGAALNLQAAARLLDDGPAKPAGVYAECVAALGYDPVARRQQAVETQPAAGGSKKITDFSKRLSEKLNKALGQ